MRGSPENDVALTALPTIQRSCSQHNFTEAEKYTLKGQECCEGVLAIWNLDVNWCSFYRQILRPLPEEQGAGPGALSLRGSCTDRIPMAWDSGCR
eukprot:2308322-Rhodomonas_salina.2